MTNREFSKTNSKFINACKKGGIKPTTRQASKYRKQTGLAWQNK